MTVETNLKGREECAKNGRVRRWKVKLGMSDIAGKCNAGNQDSLLQPKWLMKAWQTRHTEECILYQWMQVVKKRMRLTQKMSY